MKLSFLSIVMFSMFSTILQSSQVPAQKSKKSPTTQPLKADQQRQMIFNPDMKQKVAAVETRIKEILKRRNR